MCLNLADSPNITHQEAKFHLYHCKLHNSVAIHTHTHKQTSSSLHVIHLCKTWEGRRGRSTLSIGYPEQWQLPDWPESIRESESHTAISSLSSPVTTSQHTDTPWTKRDQNDWCVCPVTNIFKPKTLGTLLSFPISLLLRTSLPGVCKKTSLE